MREWMEELSDYIGDLEKGASLMSDLSEEIHQAALEADDLFAASDKLQSAYSSLVGKVDHANS